MQQFLYLTSKEIVIQTLKYIVVRFLLLNKPNAFLILDHLLEIKELAFRFFLEVHNTELFDRLDACRTLFLLALLMIEHEACLTRMEGYE
jgi:hypothetical protein